MKKLKIGMGQLLVEGGEPERNLGRAQTMAKEAHEKGCDLLLLPETLDFGWTHPSSLSGAEPIPGRFSDRICELARESHLYVCAGLTERSGDQRFNAALLVDPGGQILLKYHKINLLTVEQPFYSVGQSLSVVDTEFGKIGVNICADNYVDGLPIGHALARMGAQLILSPSSWTVDYSIDETEDPYKEKWIKPYTLLARLYDLVIVGATSVGYIVGGPYEGKKMVGCSLAVDKKGVVARGKFNEFAGDLVMADISVPDRLEKGTAIGERLKKLGCDFSAS
ncbi:MAG: carbon-nitrogen hydrolase family protein [Candidatus Omnitrophica bacterium]|nr:carbon-nitrogen hydrolase family protein [Candidatus Omnitrophota bacterium]